jgi:3'-phosphoadenosine 5'-phosphosulfate sulfotransferase (PAPS reductase)/FAD synthetase
VPLIDTEPTTPGGRAKFNPLADWTWGDVWHYIQLNEVDYNPLHDQFFPASAARPAPAPSASARISAPAAGGGKTKPPRNAACT